VEAMLQYFYEWNYQDRRGNAADNDFPVEAEDDNNNNEHDDHENGHRNSNRYGARATAVIFNAKVYAIAEKYGVADLKSLALIKLEKAAEADFKTKGLPEALYFAYICTPGHVTGLRDAVFRVVQKNMLNKEEADMFDSQPKKRGGSKGAWRGLLRRVKTSILRAFAGSVERFERRSSD